MVSAISKSCESCDPRALLGALIPPFLVHVLRGCKYSFKFSDLDSSFEYIILICLRTRNSKFVPISSDDAIFSSTAYLHNNPNKNPQTKDLCVRKVPLSKIKPQLLEKEGEGKLVEAFCAGVWGGIGQYILG